MQNLYIRDMKGFERTFAAYNPDGKPIRIIMSSKGLTHFLSVNVDMCVVN